MPIYRGSGGAGDSSTDAYASQIAVYAQTATTKANEAEASATEAAASATAAAASEAGVDADATAAEAAKVAAEAAQSAAETAQTGAETAETNAGTSETNAAASAADAAATAASIGDLDSLSDVTVTTPSTGQILKYNGSVWINDTDAGGLADIVEDTTPQLGGTLDANGNTIDMGTNEITDVKVGQWDTAYGWGDHSTAGYLTSAGFTTTVTATPTTASVGDHIHVTAATQTITLPASPSAGDRVAITVEGFTDTVIARNGNVIMDLSEDFTIDVANMGVTLIYTDATNGWRLL